MPHLILDHSPNIALDMGGLSRDLADAMAATGIFPLAGTRVRAHPATAWTIADGDPANAYCHMILRMGAGRDDATKTRAGTAIMAAASRAFAAELAGGHFALSLEIVEIDPVHTWKTNAIAKRLSGA